MEFYVLMIDNVTKLQRIPKSFPLPVVFASGVAVVIMCL